MKEERVLVAATDGQNVYHQISVVQTSDGSFYCNYSNNPKPNHRSDDHATYHGTGKAHIKIGGKRFDEVKLPPPHELGGIYHFPTQPAHHSLLKKKLAYKSIQNFKPTSVVYVNLEKDAISSTNIHAFLIDPGCIDYFKTSFLLDVPLDQIQIITRTNPWILVLVHQTPDGYFAAGPSMISNLYDRKSYEFINQQYLDKFFKVPDWFIDAKVGSGGDAE